MQAEIDAGRVYFGKDHTTQPAAISWLHELETQVATSVFDRDRNPAEVALVDILGSKRFPHPKNIEVIARLINVAAGDDAVVLDFFGGSGTTTHAVAALNQVDGGSRRSILVTNNEVVETTARKLRSAGHRPGDAEWESAGVFNYVTRPRLEAAFTGVQPGGTAPIPAKTTNISGRAMSEGLEENIEFFELRYLDRNEVERGRAFEAIAPILWLSAGGVGQRIEKRVPDFAMSPSAGYAILFDVGSWAKLSRELGAHPEVRRLFVVTESLAQYQQVVAEISPDVQTTMLYEDYLENFELNTGGLK
jgi:adenine-specific DNA-methyltransferase